MEAEIDKTPKSVNDFLTEYFAQFNSLTEEDKSDIYMLSFILEGSELKEEEYTAILASVNPHQALQTSMEIFRQRREENMTKEEREYERKTRLEDQIKDKVVLLFIQDFPDQYTEERLKEWKETGRFSRYRNYNEAAMKFADNGGWSCLGNTIYGWHESSTTEGDTIAIIDLLNLLKSNTSLTIKAKQGQAKNLELTGGSLKLLERMVIDWLQPKLDHSTSLISMASSKESYERLKRLADNDPDKLNFVWYEELTKTKNKLEEWHKEKVCYEEGKRNDYYYSVWEEIIPWTEDQSQTDRMVFLYKLGNAFQLYELDSNLDLSNGQDRKELADRIKYAIKRQRKWEIKMGKRKGNFPE